MNILILGKLSYQLVYLSRDRFVLEMVRKYSGYNFCWDGSLSRYLSVVPSCFVALFTVKCQQGHTKTFMNLVRKPSLIVHIEDTPTVANDFAMKSTPKDDNRSSSTCTNYKISPAFGLH